MPDTTVNSLWASGSGLFRRTRSFSICSNNRRRSFLKQGTQLVGLTKDFTNVKEKRHEIELLEQQG